MTYDFKYAKLRGRITEKFSTESRFAEALGVSLVIVSRKLKGKVGFSSKDILKWCEVLEIPLKEVGTYFFA
jgi:transcriptional regulator with XRE-family HTH domain